MADQAIAETRKLAWPRPAQALRFLVSDRLGLVFLFWVALAFIARPLVMQAHEGVAGPATEWLHAKFDPVSLAHITGEIQWASLAGLILILALVHVRLAFLAPLLIESVRIRFALGAAYALAFALGYIVFIWTPTSVFTLMAHDSMIFYDATYRIGQGQIPSVDFPTSLGALMLYLPALGSWLAGGYAGSVEMASGVFALIVGLAVAQAGASRFPAAVTAGLVALVFAIAVPMALLGANESDSMTIINGHTEILSEDLTYAMFYNAWGWAALVPVFAWLAPRRDGGVPPVHEIAVFGAVLAALFYLKISYLIPAAAAAAAYALLNPRPWRTMAIGAGVFAGLTLIVGVWSGLLFAYVRDIAFSAGVSGNRLDHLLPLIRMNLQDFLLAAAPFFLIGLAGKLTWRDAVVAAVVMLGSLFVVVQNARFVGLPTLIVLGAYGIARLGPFNTEKRIAHYAMYAVFLLLVAVPVFDRSFGLIDQAFAQRREEFRGPVGWAAEPALRGVYVSERESYLDLVQDAETREQKIAAFFYANTMGRKQNLRTGEYMQVVMAGVTDLRSVIRPGESVVSLDMSNPFPFILGARPAKGSWLTMENNRTFSEKAHPSAENLFADADHVMIPKVSLVAQTTAVVRDLYEDWLTAHYVQKIETPYWTRFSGRLKTVQNGPTQVAGQGAQKPPNSGL